MDKSYCVYVHTAPNGKRYVGITRQTPQGRWKNGFGYASSPHFYAAIQKYGWENFNHEIVCDGLSRIEAGNMEKQLIAKYNTHLPEFGYNCTYGGEYGVKITPDIRRKISVRAKERFSQQGNRDAQRQARLGCKHTAEAKAKISAAKKGKPHPLSDETRGRMSSANKLAWERAPDKKRRRDQCRERGLKMARPVMRFSRDGLYINTYSSAHEAERETGVRNGNISRCCNGGGKTAGGYKWQFAT